MQKPDFSLETPIAEIMRSYPQTIQVFLNHRMVCVGCHMSAFDTLADAIDNYEFSAAEFVEKLHEAILQQDEHD